MLRGSASRVNSALRASSRRTTTSVIQLRCYSRRPTNWGIVVVPQQRAWVVERFGKFHSILEPGLNFLIPLVDRISYDHSLKETALSISSQSAITKDNVTLFIDGVLYYRIKDPYPASYNIDDPIFAITQLAQTSMRSEIGKLTLDETFKERETLNAAIIDAMSSSSARWGMECTRYEIKDITAPPSIRDAMDKQAEAERKKRAFILESEGQRSADINIAEGRKQAAILASEAVKAEVVNKAAGESEAALLMASANANAIQVVAQAIAKQGGGDAAALKVAEKYIDAFSQLAKTNNSMILNSNVGDVSSFVAQAMSVYRQVSNNAISSSSSSSSPLQNDNISSPAQPSPSAHVTRGGASSSVSSPPSRSDLSSN